MKLLIAALTFLGISFLILGVRVIVDRREIQRLKRSGYRKLAFKRASRGSVDADFLRCIAEFTLLLLLLAAVFGWLAHSSPQ